jgi:IS4 transposase
LNQLRFQKLGRRERRALVDEAQRFAGDRGVLVGLAALGDEF